MNKNTLIFLLSSIGLIVFPHIYNVPPSIFGYFIILLSWRFISIWKPGWLPNDKHLIILIILGIALLIAQHRSILGRDGGTNVFIISLALKLMEIKTERDLCLVTYLAFVVAASLFLYQQNLLMAAYILIISCALLATLVSIHSVTPQTRIALKTAAVIIAQAIPLTIILFILFPRIEAPKWMLFEEKHKAKLGLSDHLEPGSISDLGMSDELAFRVKFIGALPPPKQRYWRGPVFSHTDGVRWTQGAMGYQRFLDTPTFSGTAYSYTLLMESQEKNWVFALDMPAQFSAPLSQNGNYQLITSEDPHKRAEHKITSYPKYNTGYLTKTEYQDSLRLPAEPSDKIKQLVTTLHGFDNPPEVFINALLEHFRIENFHYTLTPPLMEDRPIEKFLFETRYGFCSHYATAFVYLMRVAHIPARVVTGYQGGELNKIGDFLEIRQVNAHAWAEVWLENKGWTRFDPTAAIAPERVEQNMNLEQLVPDGIISFKPTKTNAAFNFLKRTRQLWDNADYQWQRLVVNYDSLSQSKFLSSFGITELRDMIYWMQGLLFLVAALLSATLLRSKQKTDKVLRIYGRFCRELSKKGFTRGNSEGAIDFAKRVTLHKPTQTQAIDEITALFIKLRYGRSFSIEEMRRFSQLVAGFKVL